MSEKQLASSWDSFVDLTEMQIVDLLNKLSDENTRLHKKVDEQQATINELKAKLKEKEEEEKLYANEILELREINKEFIKFKELGGDY